MKKLTSVLLSGVMAASMCATAAISASAEVTELPADWDPTQYSYTVVGDAGLLGDAAWQPENDDFNMSYDEAAGVWYLNLNGVGNQGTTFNYGAQYKVVVRNYVEGSPWEFSFNENGVAYGYDSNSIVDFGETAETADVVTILFDGQKTTSRIDNPYTVAPVEHTYFAVGDANLFDPAWTPNDPKFQLTQDEDGGLYKVTIPVTEEQWENPFEYKVAQDGTWDVSYNDQGEALGDGTNAIGFIDENTAAVVITWDPATMKAGFECVPVAEQPTDAPTDAPTDEPTDAPTDAPTETPSEVVTGEPTEDGTSATNATTDATSATSAATSGSTTAGGTTGGTTGGTSSGTTSGSVSSATGKVATGDSTSVAILLGMLMLAGGAVVVARKRVTK